MKIRTEFVYLAPDSERYVTIDDDRYDGAEDAGHQLVGRGATEEASRRDYFDQLVEEGFPREERRDADIMFNALAQPHGPLTPRRRRRALAFVGLCSTEAGPL